VDRPGGRVAVDEDRRGPGVMNRVRARGEGQRRAGDLVTRSDTQDDECKMQSGGAARESERVRDADDVGELPLECVHLWPERRDPVRLDRLPEELQLAA